MSAQLEPHVWTVVHAATQTTLTYVPVPMGGREAYAKLVLLLLLSASVFPLHKFFYINYGILLLCLRRPTQIAVCQVWELTHWGRVTHICVGKLTTRVFGRNNSSLEAVIPLKSIPMSGIWLKCQPNVTPSRFAPTDGTDFALTLCRS